jgi:hypothetical protein
MRMLLTQNANIGKSLLADNPWGESETWLCVVHPIRKQSLTIAMWSTDKECKASAVDLITRLPASLTAIDLWIRFPLQNLCLMYMKWAQFRPLVK